jgi:alkylation response protein AidB-like acyl-CoA dehydrogenase
MQILASAGYRRGSVVERLFRDARAAEIYQGTSEVQRLVIAKALLDTEHNADDAPDAGLVPA